MAQFLEVYMNDELVGHLRQDLDAGMTFKYISEAKNQLSLSLPIRSEPYAEKECKNFFDALLPESERARRAIANHYGATNSNSPFSLLKAVGRDCAGAISFYEEGQKPTTTTGGDLKVLSDRALAKLIEELPSRPLFTGVDGVRISLAGIQDKAAVTLTDDGKIALPIESPSTHILKPALLDLQESAVNEFLTMTLAKDLNLDCAEVELRRAGDREYLLVKRFDRQLQSDGSQTRIHQEDFCQVLNIPSINKYEIDGGPSIKMCFELMDNTRVPAKSKLTLLDQMLFNYIVGNTDAHGKNYSLLYKSKGKPILAPLYDCLSLSMMESLSKEMAMRIGKQSGINNVSEKNWQDFSQTCSISFNKIRTRIDELTETTEALLSMPPKTKSAYEKLWRDAMLERCRLARKSIGL